MSECYEAPSLEKFSSSPSFLRVLANLVVVLSMDRTDIAVGLDHMGTVVAAELDCSMDFAVAVGSNRNWVLLWLLLRRIVVRVLLLRRIEVRILLRRIVVRLLVLLLRRIVVRILLALLLRCWIWL